MKVRYLRTGDPSQRAPDRSTARTFHLPEWACAGCGQSLGGEPMFMVRDNLWRRTGFGTGMAHMRCVEAKIGRPLVMRDFTKAFWWPWAHKFYWHREGIRHIRWLLSLGVSLRGKG